MTQSRGRKTGRRVEHAERRWLPVPFPATQLKSTGGTTEIDSCLSMTVTVDGPKPRTK
jgi:hypothetical protein